MLTLATWVKLNSQAAGKDKIARLLQYLAKFLVHRVQMLYRAKETLRRLQILESFLYNYRKVMRLGKSVEVLYGALTTLNISNRFLRVVTTISRCNSAIYLVLDNIMCIQRAGLIEFSVEKISHNANRFWLASTLCNLLRDMYEIFCIFSSDSGNNIWADSNSVKCLCENSLLYKNLSIARPIFRFAELHRPVFLDTLKNMCDIVLPLNSLGKVNVRSDVLGVLGVVSSYLAILAIVDPTAKLAYS